MLLSRMYSLVGLLALWIAGCQAVSRGTNISCYQCNVYKRGKKGTCEKEFVETPEATILPECDACLKMFTRTSLHDRYGRVRQVDTVEKSGETGNAPSNYMSYSTKLEHTFRSKIDYVSRVCVRYGDSRQMRDDGCYTFDGYGGFSILCYCRTPLCNTARTIHASYFLMFVVPLLVYMCRL